MWLACSSTLLHDFSQPIYETCVQTSLFFIFSVLRTLKVNDRRCFSASDSTTFVFIMQSQWPNSRNQQSKPWYATHVPLWNDFSTEDITVFIISQLGWFLCSFKFFHCTFIDQNQYVYFQLRLISCDAPLPSIDSFSFLLYLLEFLIVFLHLLLQGVCLSFQILPQAFYTFEFESSSLDMLFTVRIFL